MSSQASLIHLQISSSLTLRMRPPAVKLCCPANIQSCHFARMWSLKGLLMDTSKGWSMLVMPPGITTHSVLMDLKVLRTGLDKWALNESQTSIDFRRLRPPTLLQTVRNQSCTSCSSIQPFAWHLTTTSFRKFKFLGSVFRLNTTYGGSLVPSPRQASITVNLSLSWPTESNDQRQVSICLIFIYWRFSVQFVTPTSQFTPFESNGLVYKPHPRFLTQNFGKKVRLIHEFLRYSSYFLVLNIKLFMENLMDSVYLYSCKINNYIVPQVKGALWLDLHFVAWFSPFLLLVCLYGVNK